MKPSVRPLGRGTKNPAGGIQKVDLTLEQALDVIRKLDNLTCGIPKVVYLVGWQFDGHDSKYPSLSEVNPALKRPRDAAPAESLGWLIREARKHHTAVIAYSRDGYENKSWPLPAAWGPVNNVRLARITLTGPEAAGELPGRNGRATLRLDKQTALTITPDQKTT